MRRFHRATSRTHRYNEDILVANAFAPDDAPLYEVLVHGAFHSTFSDLIYLHAFKADDTWKAHHRYDLDPARALAITNDFLRASSIAI